MENKVRKTLLSCSNTGEKPSAVGKAGGGTVWFVVFIRDVEEGICIMSTNCNIITKLVTNVVN